MREQQRQLIRRMAIHEQEAEREFVDSWEPDITRWVTDCAPLEKVEEYVQEVWLHLFNRDWRNLLKWRALYEDDEWHEHSLKGFLKTVTINKVTDLQRATQWQQLNHWDPAEILTAPGDLGDDPVLDAEAIRLMAAYENCTSHYRDKDHKLVSMWFEGYSARLIAEMIGTNANNVHQRKSYLFKRLQDCLTEKLPEYFRHV